MSPFATATEKAAETAVRNRTAIRRSIGNLRLLLLPAELLRLTGLA